YFLITFSGFSSTSHRYHRSFPTRRSSDLYLCRPLSRGHVRIVSPDPRDNPHIIFNHLEREEDRVGLVEGMKMAKKIADAMPVKEDRKSTRLNSSHVKISYAVFCLKKKKQT